MNSIEDGTNINNNNIKEGKIMSNFTIKIIYNTIFCIIGNNI